MKYLGSIQDNKDLVTKEYVDDHHDSTKQDVIDSSNKLSYSYLSDTPNIVSNGVGAVTNRSVQLNEDPTRTTPNTFVLNNPQSEYDGDTFNAGTGIDTYDPADNRTGLYAVTMNEASFACGNNAVAEGHNCIAKGDCSHAEGESTVASGGNARSAGRYTVASGFNSLAEGWGSVASGNQSRADGYFTVASGSRAFSSGVHTTASGENSFVTGERNVTSGKNAFAAGGYNVASGINATALGGATDYDEPQKLFEATFCSQGADSKSLNFGYIVNRNDSYSKAKTYDVTFAPSTRKIYLHSYIDSDIEWSKLVSLTGCKQGTEYANSMEFDPIDDAHFPNKIKIGSTGLERLVNKWLRADDTIYGVVFADSYTFTGSTSKNLYGVCDITEETYNDYAYKFADSVRLYYNETHYATFDIINCEPSDTEDLDTTPYLVLDSDIPQAMLEYEYIDLYFNCTQSNLLATTYSNIRTIQLGSSGITRTIDSWLANASGYITGVKYKNDYEFSGSTTKNIYSINPIDGINTASGDYSHAEGQNCIASGARGHAEGGYTTASGADSHAENWETVASGNNAHAEGYHTTASGEDPHAEGCYTTASGNYGAHAEGNRTTASGHYGSHAEGYNTTASSNQSHAEGRDTIASNRASHAEGWATTASGEYGSHSEGYKTTASGKESHAEGYEATASKDASHAEGCATTASGLYSHAEGAITTASGNYSHAEGYSTIASDCCHAEGNSTSANNFTDHAEGEFSVASGGCSHVEGCYTTAASQCQHVQGKYNVIDSSSTYADIVGWGTSTSARKNISALTTGGTLRLKGDVYVNCADNSTGGYQLEKVSNKVTSISSSSTDTQYPSAKAMYTELSKSLQFRSTPYYLPQNEECEEIEWSKICYGAGKYIILQDTFWIGSSIFSAYSTDATNWTTVTSDECLWWNNVVYGNNIFIASGNSDEETSNILAISNDGINWTISRLEYNIGKIYYVNGKFITGFSKYDEDEDTEEYYLKYSLDGAIWNLLDTTQLENFNSFEGFTYGNGIFVGIYTTTNGYTQSTYSEDGIIWVSDSQHITTSTLGYNSKITFGNGRFVLVSCIRNYDSTLRKFFYNNYSYYSTDGHNWNLGYHESNQDYGFGKIVYGNGQFIAIANSGAIVRSTNGIDWTFCSIASGISLYDIIYADNKFRIISYDRQFYSNDGVYWYTGDQTIVLNNSDIGTDVANTLKEMNILEASSNKVTSLSSASTDTQYPSAKLVYDSLAGKAAVSHNHIISNVDGLQTALDAKQKTIYSGTSEPSGAVNGDLWIDTDEQVDFVILDPTPTQNSTNGITSGGVYAAMQSILPAVTAADNGKVLMVVNGAWAAVTLPTFDGSVV